jgi:hypothetical protein
MRLAVSIAFVHGNMDPAVAVCLLHAIMDKKSAAQFKAIVDEGSLPTLVQEVTDIANCH